MEAAYGFVGEFVARISLVFLGNALLSVGLALLQVSPDVGYLLSTVVYGVAGLWGGVWWKVASYCFACQKARSISPRAVGGWSSSAWGCCWKPQATAAVRMAMSRSVRFYCLRQGRSMAL